MIINNGKKRRDSTPNCIDQYRMKQEYGYEVSSTNEETGVETTQNFGDEQGYFFWENNKVSNESGGRELGTWAQITPAIVQNDKVYPAALSSDGIIADTRYVGKETTESIPDEVSEAHNYIVSTEGDIENGDIGLALATINDAKQETIFFKSASAGSDIFLDKGDGTVELLSAQMVPTGQIYQGTPLDPATCFHGEQYPWKAGRRYFGRILNNAQAFVDLQGFGPLSDSL